MSARAVLLLAVSVVCACRSRPPDPPELTAVSPSAVRQGVQTELVLHGRGFLPRLQVDLDTPERSQPQGAFTAALASGAEELLLSGVQRHSPERLTAFVPASTPAAHYDVLVRDGWGRTTRLAAALRVGAECVDAAACDDGLACTEDACIDGVCAHTPAADTCVIGGACHDAGAIEPEGGCRRCTPALAVNAWSVVPDGTPCEDGDLCTSGETCHAQQCGAPTETVSCPAISGCHLPGLCDPATGACSTPAVPDGTPCDDGDLCTLGEACAGGVCGNAQPVSCPAVTCQGEGVCNPATGACERPPLAGSCDDQSPCTSNDACVDGLCRGEVGVCGDTMPLACLQLDAAGVAIPGEVTLDPRCTTDLETPTEALEARFDLDGDGVFDTPFEPLAPRVAQVTAVGLHALSVEVRDPGGNVASAVRYLAGFEASRAVVVTTPADELDPGATVAAPGGTGLSLAEAMVLVNASDTLRTIRFAEPMTVHTGGLPILTAPFAQLVGGPQVRVAFSTGNGDPCLRLRTDQLLLGLELSGCGDTQVELGGERSRVLDSTLRGGEEDGVAISGADNTVGPGVEISGFGNRGVFIRADRATLRGVRSWGNAAAGIQVGPVSTGSQLLQCRSWANLGAGIAVAAQVHDARLWQNTVHHNGADGVDVSSTASGIDLRGNLLTGNGRFGACGLPANFAHTAPNGYWGNALGALCSGTVAAPSLEADPVYVRAGGDFRLAPGSPAIDASVALGPDLNGASGGDWSGSLPDLGAVESGQ